MKQDHSRTSSESSENLDFLGQESDPTDSPEELLPSWANSEKKRLSNTFLNSIPDPSSLSDEAFIEAMMKLFFEFLLFTLEHSGLQEISIVFVKNKITEKLRATSDEERDKLAAWYGDNRFIGFLALLEVNLRKPVCFFNNIMTKLIEQHDAKEIESIFHEKIMGLHGGVAAWFSPYKKDTSILYLLKEIEKEKGRENTVVKLRQAKERIKSTKKSYEKYYDEKAQAESPNTEQKKSRRRKKQAKSVAMPQKPTELDVAENAVKYFLHQGIQNPKLRVIDLCGHIIFKKEDMLYQQKAEDRAANKEKQDSYYEEHFDYPTFVYNQLFESMHGFLAVKTENMHEWMQEYFFTLLNTLNSLCNLNETILNSLDDSFGQSSTSIPALKSYSSNNSETLNKFRQALFDLLKKPGSGINLARQTTRRSADSLADTFFIEYTKREKLISSDTSHQNSLHALREKFLCSTPHTTPQETDVSAPIIAMMLDENGAREELSNDLIEKHNKRRRGSGSSGTSETSGSEAGPLLKTEQPQAKQAQAINRELAWLIVGVLLTIAAILLAVYLVVQSVGILPVILGGALGLGSLTGGTAVTGLIAKIIALRKIITRFFKRLFGRPKQPRKTATSFVFTPEKSPTTPPTTSTVHSKRDQERKRDKTSVDALTQGGGVFKTVEKTTAVPTSAPERSSSATAASFGC